MIKQALALAQEFKRMREDAEPEEISTNYNTLIDEMNKRLKDFPLSCLSGQILEVTIPASSEIRVSHSLKTVPKYRLILGQTGNGVITDVKGKDSNGFPKWSKDYVTLKNNGAVVVTLNLMLMRE